MQANDYWSGLVYPPDPSRAWLIDFSYGYQSVNNDELFGLNALAVRTGDVAVVPEPEVFEMLLLGLGGLSVVARRRGLVRRWPAS